ncbi:MAG TPA: mechanosensitive ion channel family protein [Candidatus Limnocylindrales bacterium]|nr:mechanosensitive ion channel family protein [Candidatus Limnocylindrales bacterium]
MPDLGSPPWRDVLAIAVIVVVALVAVRGVRLFVRGVVGALFARETAEGTARELTLVEVAKRRETIETLGSRVLQAFVVVVAALMILGKLNYEIGPAVAGLGVVGIAVGFGAQSLVRDYFTGALILIENQFSIGDVVTIAGVTGTVEDLSLRRTTLRDLDGVVHTVPNGEIKVASNRTRTWARINQDVTISYGTDLERATGVVDRVGIDLAADPVWKQRILEPPCVERVEALAEYGITLKILGSVRAIDQWAAAGELRKRLLAAFAENGIEIPRPQRVVLARDPDGPGPLPPEAVVEPAGGGDGSGSAT